MSDAETATSPAAPAVILRPDGGLAGGARERFQRLYHILRSRICLLDYPPGTRLSEEVLATEFGVSRTPLRRVLGRLETEGLLTSVHGVGTIVTDVDIEALTQVYQLRLELDTQIGKLSPVPPSEETLALFRDLCQRTQELIARPEPREFATINMEFFHALMRLTANEPLQAISERLYYQTSRIWLKSLSQLQVGRDDYLAREVFIFSREVADILTAIEIGDLEAVGHLRRSHVAMSFARLRSQPHNQVSD